MRGIENKLRVRPDKEPRADDEIWAHITRRFRADVWLTDFGIIPMVRSGNVILEGSAGTLEQLKLAVEKAWVRGVISVDSTALKVDPMVRDISRRPAKKPTLPDEEIIDAIRDALAHHSWVRSTEIDVLVKDSVVTLRGEVDSFRIKQAVRRTAMNTVGVGRVNDMITIGTNDTPVADGVIRDRVTRSLKRNFHTSRYPLEVEVNDGKVTLRGTVETPFERNQAEVAIASAYGVRDIENQIRTNRLLRGYDPKALEDLADADQPQQQGLGEKQEDEQIKKEVESEIFWSWWVDSDTVNVTVKNGEVTLSGTVDSEREKRAATANAFDGGAVTVVNQLNVRP